MAVCISVGLNLLQLKHNHPGSKYPMGGSYLFAQLNPDVFFFVWAVYRLYMYFFNCLLYLFLSSVEPDY